ncbi:MAG: peptide chain release factor N(5)-glutamine methyltransferase [Sulfurimonadaceae bacterium]|jgi:release factor glutamine methyltransferase|nr:peptide chain release factor N(5)-glutamine methyltransferase [Sulfurimonadaceae bacterium]
MPSYYLIKDAQKEITTQLAPFIERAGRESQLFLMHHLGCDELTLLMRQNEMLENPDMLFAMVERRKAQEPFEYITSKVSFYSEEFYIAKGALIPRPETELLIDEVLQYFPQTDAKITFVEVGIGSGIISIMLAKHYPHAKFIGVDISEAALLVAKINIEKFGLQERIELRLGSLLDVVDEGIDYLISNPPYIANDIELEHNLSYEPQNALFGGEIGDEIIQKLLSEVLKRKINLFTCEMGYDQKDKITNFLQTQDYESLHFYKDLSDFDRGFTLRIKN